MKRHKDLAEANQLTEDVLRVLREVREQRDLNRSHLDAVMKANRALRAEIRPLRDALVLIAKNRQTGGRCAELAQQTLQAVKTARMEGS